MAIWAAWIAFPLAGAVWVATWYGANWYHYDEWTTIDRSFDSWWQMFAGHQGHLEVWSYLVYRFQRSWFGLEGHHLVWLAFMTSLVAFQLGVAAVLTRLRVPAVLALLAASVITFFGIGGQSSVWQFQLGINLALAGVFFATFVALGREQTRRSALVVAALLVFALAADSGLAAVGSILVGVVIVVVWPRRLALLALAPAVIGHLAWFAFGDQGVNLGTTFTRMRVFAKELVLLAAGGLVGGGETESTLSRAQGREIPPDPVIPMDGTTVGIIVLALATACIVYAIVRRRLDRRLAAVLVGGLVAAAVMAGSLARTRAFLVRPENLPGSRYVQWVAVFLMLAIAPVVAAVLRSGDARRNRVLGVLAAAMLIGVLALSVDQLAPVRAFTQKWGTDVKHHLAEAIAVVNRGCGEGQELDADAQPIPDLAPQIDVEVIEQVLADESLPRSFGVPPPAGMRDALCRRARGAR